MATEFHFEPDGFMSSPPYLFHFHAFFKDFEEAFPGLARINVIHHERSYFELGHRISVSSFTWEEGVGTLRFNTQKYYDQRGRVTSITTPSDIFGDLRELLNRSKEQYARERSER